MLPWSVDAGIEAVGKGIVGEFPDMSKWQIGGTWDANVILRDAKRAAAD